MEEFQSEYKQAVGYKRRQIYVMFRKYDVEIEERKFLLYVDFENLLNIEFLLKEEQKFMNKILFRSSIKWKMECTLTSYNMY
ncbi:MAG: hypothetical protein Ta2E_10560 [Mycoplasmoidaceae bacterium]|nr:MAG: hypothetical protein Ta2E_10560 [Mycoplasmoidaceae bacterium]